MPSCLTIFVGPESILVPLIEKDGMLDSLHNAKLYPGMHGHENRLGIFRDKDDIPTNSVLVSLARELGHQANVCTRVRRQPNLFLVHYPEAE